MGFWSGLGKVLKVAAPIAATFIPGIGPVAGPMLASALNGSGGDNSGQQSSSIGPSMEAMSNYGIDPPEQFQNQGQFGSLSPIGPSSYLSIANQKRRVL